MAICNFCGSRIDMIVEIKTNHIYSTFDNVVDAIYRCGNCGEYLADCYEEAKQILADGITPGYFIPEIGDLVGLSGDDLVCGCGCVMNFLECDDKGNQVEPDEYWDGKYCCQECGAIIEFATLEVTGICNHPTIL